MGESLKVCASTNVMKSVSRGKEVLEVAVFSDRELSNRETAGFEAMESGNWRLAYDCFNDCAEYIIRTRPWDNDSITRYENLAETCRKHF